MAELANQQQDKVLRIGVVKDGKVVHEKLIKPGQSVTIGESAKNTFVVSGATFGKRHTLFVAKGDTYGLQFTEKMDGRLSTREGIQSLVELREKGTASRKGDAWLLPLEHKSRGKVAVDDYTVLFQFVAAPPESARVVAGVHDFRPKLLEEDDPVFLGLLALFSGMAAVLMIYVYNTEPVEMVGLEDIPDRFVDLVIPASDTPVEEIKIEDPNAESTEVKKEEVKKEEVSKDTKERKPKTAEERAREEAARIQKKKDDLSKKSKLLAGLIGTTGSNNSGQTVEDVFGDKDAKIQSLEEALKGVSGSGIANEESMGLQGGADRSGRGDSSIGDLNRGGAGESNVGAGPATKLRSGNANLGTIDVSEGENVDKVRVALKKYQTQVKACYEVRLKENPNLSGRIAISVTVNSGQVRGVKFDENTTGDKDLETCVTGKVRTWRFDSSVTDEIYLPFALSPS